MKFKLAILATLGFLATSTFAQISAPTPSTNSELSIPFSSKALIIDANFKDWPSNAATIPSLLNFEGEKASVNSQIRLLWNKEYLYVAAHFEDSSIISTLSKHDQALFNEDCFEIFFDPKGTGTNYIEWGISPKNTTYDLMMSKPYSENGKDSMGFEINALKSAAHIYKNATGKDSAWAVELAIPFKSITPDEVKTNQVWNLLFARVNLNNPKLEQKDLLNAWTYTGGVTFHNPKAFGKVKFVYK